MTPFLADPDVTLWHGDALEVLRELPSETVHCVATSPPFYALRDYGVDGQIGLEDTPEEWCAKLVAVFAECRRVLVDEGTLWVEVGDSYSSGGRVGHGTRQGYKQQTNVGSLDQPRRDGGVKAKDLLGTPWMLAFALRADGWFLRRDNIWWHTNAMPESVTDRSTTAHSYVFHLAKRASYYHDADAVREPAEWARWGDQTTPKYDGADMKAGWIKPRSKDELEERYVNRGNRQTNGQRERTADVRGFDNRLDSADGQKNQRSVWPIPTRGYPDAHFATWPEKLATRIILAACPPGGTVLDPFVGSGTTCKVARNHGRHSIGIDLNADYLELAATRLQQLSLLTGEAHASQ